MPYLLFGLLHSLHLANLLPPTKALHGSFLYVDQQGLTDEEIKIIESIVEG